MDIKSKAELNARVAKTLADYPKAACVFATLDGNIFLRENDAHNHARGTTVLKFERKEKLDLKEPEPGDREPENKEPGNPEPENKEPGDPEPENKEPKSGKAKAAKSKKK